MVMQAMNPVEFNLVSFSMEGPKLAKKFDFYQEIDKIKAQTSKDARDLINFLRDNPDDANFQIQINNNLDCLILLEIIVQ